MCHFDIEYSKTPEYKYNIWREILKIISKQYKQIKENNMNKINNDLTLPENTYLVLYIMKNKEGKEELQYRILTENEPQINTFYNEPFRFKYITDYREALEKLKTINVGDRYYLVQLKGIMNLEINNELDRKTA